MMHKKRQRWNSYKTKTSSFRSHNIFFVFCGSRTHTHTVTHPAHNSCSRIYLSTTWINRTIGNRRMKRHEAERAWERDRKWSNLHIFHVEWITVFTVNHSIYLNWCKFKFNHAIVYIQAILLKTKSQIERENVDFSANVIQSESYRLY